jgi:hypothetical protein
MVRRYSDAFESSTKAFENAGVFNGFIEVDTKLYIDPHLLEHSSAPELKLASKEFKKYFSEIIKILRQAPNRSGVLWRQAVQKLTFREITQLSLGYSSGSVKGSAIGPKLAQSITATAHEIIAAGINEPEIFELIGLLEDGIGADRISDMTARVILDYLLAFSQRIVTQLKLSKREYTYKNKAYELPYDKITGRYVILLPTDILRKLPVAHDWSDIDVVCAHNAVLRREVNQLIGRTWRKATTKVSKSDLKDVLLARPQVLLDLVTQYKAKQGRAYDFSLDPAGEITWHSVTHDYADKYPLDLSRYKKINAGQIFPLVQELCNRFKQLIENNGLNELLYNNSRKLKNERAAQLIFFGVADAYCQVSNIDINRESNAGRGPVDFKISYGYNARVTVEIKYSSNPHLLDGYTEQLKTYNKAEKTSHSIFLVIQTGIHKKKLENLDKLFKDAKSKGERSPEVIIVDGQRYSSASKLRRK